MDDTFSFFGRSVPDLAKIIGSILVIFGIATYIISDQSSFTALIPSFMGAPLSVLGILSERMPDMRHHLMHASMVLALFMVIMPISMVAMMGIPDSSLTLASLMALLVMGSIFMVAGIKSFRHARILRESSGV
tara:strand:- start:4955 stop:5353 length:399 start_codon:yes stop_codon:yes gene_type:complete